MASITEATVVVELVVRLEGAEGAESTRIIARAVSYAADGSVVRRADRDITASLSAARQQGSADLLADVTAKVKALWGIA